MYSLFIIHGYISYLTSGIDPVFVLSPTSLLPSVFVLWYIWLPGLWPIPVYWPWFLPVPFNLISVHCTSGSLLHLHFSFGASCPLGLPFPSLGLPYPSLLVPVWPSAHGIAAPGERRRGRHTQPCRPTPSPAEGLPVQPSPVPRVSSPVPRVPSLISRVLSPISQVPSPFPRVLSPAPEPWPAQPVPEPQVPRPAQPVPEKFIILA